MRSSSTGVFGGLANHSHTGCRPSDAVYGYVGVNGLVWTGAHDGVGDTKAGTLIGQDRFGNRYFENLQEELPCMAYERSRHERL